MNATKYTLELFATGLHRDCLRNLLLCALEELDKEVDSLYKRFQDGDTIHFEIKTQGVTF